MRHSDSKNANPTAPMAVATVCSRNRLPSARTLMRSVRAVYPDWKQYVLLADELDDTINPDMEPFELVTVDRIDLPEFRKFCFRYDIMEFDTAVKPYLLDWMFEQKGHTQCMLLDSDIFLYSPMVELEQFLNSGAMMVLTPHLTAPQYDGKCPGEVEVLLAGTYNLGMLAVARHPDLRAFLEWWKARLEYDCVNDAANGYFVDQKWMDLTPGLFDGIHILRDEGYNVAYWNLPHRRCTHEGDRFFFNGRPLVFFHFSGLDPEKPEGLSRHQNRFTLSDLGPGRALIEDYCRAVLADGASQAARAEYAFKRFSDGTPIPYDIRAAYRRQPSLQQLAGDDPFALDHGIFNEPWKRAGKGPGLVTELMGLLWEQHQPVREAFSPVVDRDLAYVHRRRFIQWFVEHAKEEYGVPEAFIAPVRKAAPWLASPFPGTLTRLSRLGTATVTEAVRSAGRLVWSNAHRSDEERLHLVQAVRQLHDADDYSGFHPQDPADKEKGVAWMGPIAQVRILRPEPGTLRLVGETPRGLHLAAGHMGAMEIRLYIDGRPHRTVKIRKRGEFDVAVPFEAGQNSGPVLLTLIPNHFTVPESVGAGDDPRALSVRLSRIELNGSPVLDFSEPFAPYRDSAAPQRDRLHMNVIGYHGMPSGIGESARLFAATARAVGLPHSICTIGDPSDPERCDRIDMPESPGPINVMHVNASHTVFVSGLLGWDILEQSYNIGYWHWELDTFPDMWRNSYRRLQEVWVPTRFVADAIAPTAPVPVVRIPHAIDVTPPAHLDRRSLGLPEDKFLFLLMYDMRSSQSRKNPEAAVRAFRKAFGNDPHVGLVIKVQCGATSPADMERLRQEVADLPSVTLIDRTLTRDSICALEAACDAFVSLHRSEGFGLCLAECMYLGKPVVATAYSGNTDFMRPGNSCPVEYTLTPLKEETAFYPKGAHWAEPDEDHAATLMKQLVADDSFRRRIAESGRQTIRTEFSRQTVGELIRTRLTTIADMRL